MTIHRIRIICETSRTPMVGKTCEILARTLRERYAVNCVDENADYNIILKRSGDIGAEGFSIADTEGGIAITGNDERGLLYGAGKFLRSCRFEEQGMEPGAWRGVSVPVKPVRGMYFASHFHNFYHDAPVEAVERYVEELALWGCNALSVWFDMHHYQGMDDPEARLMVERLRVILKAAEKVGIGLAFTSLANEAFASSPEGMRAEWTAQNGYHAKPGGHYHVEICPNSPGGLEKILEYRRAMLEAFKDLNIEYVWTWPYDQGGCTCRKCAPWGVNGYLKCAEAEAALVREYFPEVKIIFSTWYFDRFTTGEWEGLDKAFNTQKPDWVDYMMIDDHGSFPDYPLQHGVPGGFPSVGFPEISMARMWPWGGFGANPRPQYWQGHWNKVRDLVSGSFPYSEGIFEDINKVLQLQFGWHPDRKAEEILSEYISYEYSPDVVQEVLEAVRSMEKTQNHYLKDNYVERIWELYESADGHHGGDTITIRDMEGLYVLPGQEAPSTCLDLLDGADAKLPSRTRQRWRWRILWLRAALDKELHESGGTPTDKSEAFFDELTQIFHAREAEPAVVPPSLRNLRRVSQMVQCAQRERRALSGLL